ncbi:MAG: DUF2971 domain-containing protein [Candidatus Kapaibacterium sp.]
MSDPLEVKLGIDVFVDVLIEGLNSTRIRKHKTKLGTLLLHTHQVFNLRGDERFTVQLRRKMGMPEVTAKMTQFIDTYGGPDPERVRAIYVACFTEESDAISQWRLYGANGSGVALGFNFTDGMAIERYDKRHVPIRVGKVSYDVERVKKRQERIVEKLLSSDGNIWAVAEKCYRDAVLLKQPDYSHESEWRLYMYATALRHSPKVSISRGRVRPYVSITNFDKKRDEALPLATIVTGPLSSFDGESDQDWRLFVAATKSGSLRPNLQFAKSEKRFW